MQDAHSPAAILTSELGQPVVSHRSGLAQELNELLEKDLMVFDLALPHDHGAPPKVRKGIKNSGVPTRVSCQLCVPVCRVRRGLHGAITIVMLMPETSMNKDNFSSTPEHEVRSTGQVGRMHAEAVSCAMDEPPHSKFSTCVNRLHLPHNSTAHSVVINVHSHSPCDGPDSFGRSKYSTIILKRGEASVGHS